DLGVAKPVLRWLASLRLLDQDTSLEIEMVSCESSQRELLESFNAAYRRLYGYLPVAGREVECVALRVVAEEAAASITAETFGDDRCEGPRMIQDRFSTCIVPADWTLRRGSRGTLLLERAAAAEVTLRARGEVRA